MKRKLKCPVCGKPLTEQEYDIALGLWKDKQEHIKHLEDEQKKLIAQQIQNKKMLESEKKKLKEREKAYLKKINEQDLEFKKQQAKLKEDSKKALTAQTKKFNEQIKNQKNQLEKNFNQKLKTEIKKGVEKGVTEQKKAFIKQEAELKKTQNKMKQLENSLKISAKKYDQANSEIKKLKEQIEKGITPQIEGLLEEDKLLAKLKELFPQDKFEHPGKSGDIIQFVYEQNKEIGIIVYECKKVKVFNRNHIKQAKDARKARKADFAILVTNAFPSKKQYYFVEDTVFVISPISLEPITITLRDGLVKISILKISNESKEKAVQRIYNYLSSNEYNNKINDVAGQLIELGRDLKSEIYSHKKTWKKRYDIYRCLFTDIGSIDNSLKDLVKNNISAKSKLLLPEKNKFTKIAELE